MSVITLLTDFGTHDEYVGVMKGVILSVNPDVVIVDITHHIDPQDVFQAAYTLQSAYTYFPKGTVHVVVVDPGVGSKRSILAVQTEDHVFLAPDNGVLTLMMDAEYIEKIIRVENPKYFLNTVSQTFHGRDIFAPVVAYISKGLQIEKTGSVIDLKDVVRLPVYAPYILDKNELIGNIVYIDRFGNLITNIDLKWLEKFCNSGKKESFEIQIGRKRIMGLSQSYASVKSQHPLAIIGSRGCLEIAVNCGNAQSYFRAERGEQVVVRDFEENNLPKTVWRMPIQ